MPLPKVFNLGKLGYIYISWFRNALVYDYSYFDYSYFRNISGYENRSGHRSGNWTNPNNQGNQNRSGNSSTGDKKHKGTWIQRDSNIPKP